MNRNIDVIFLVKHFLWLIWVEGKEGRMRGSGTLSLLSALNKAFFPLPKWAMEMRFQTLIINMRS